MSTLFRADDRNAAYGPATTHAVDGDTDGVGVYLTDEVFLWRVVGFLQSGEDQLVELEDCYWLDVVRVRVSDLHARPLRVVKCPLP
jgi:hypothetical protein